MLPRTRFRLPLLLLLAGVAALTFHTAPTSARLPVEQSRSSSLLDHYGVWVGDGDPGQVRALGLRWWISFHTIDWLRGRVLPGIPQRDLPDGLNTAFIVPAGVNDIRGEALSVDDIAWLAGQFPGAYWILGNEPNVRQSNDNTNNYYPTHWETMAPDLYAQRLHWWATTLKQIDPSAQIVGPNVLNWTFTCVGCGGFQTGLEWTREMRGAYQKLYGKEPPLDIWSVHAYDLDWDHLPQGNAQRMIDQIQGMRNWLDAISGLAGAPMWVSEIGLHWGYPGITVDDNGELQPVGDFDFAHAENFISQVFGWLNQNADRLNIQRWFFAGISSSGWAGLVLMDGPDVAAPVNPLGQLFQKLAGVQGSR